MQSGLVGKPLRAKGRIRGSMVPLGMPSGRYGWTRTRRGRRADLHRPVPAVGAVDQDRAPAGVDGVSGRYGAAEQR
eukprot:scaffold11986_cov127-Isochrysis_galbana.AAC.7